MNSRDTIKHYIISLMVQQGLQVDEDTHAELDEALGVIDDLEKRVTRIEKTLAHLDREVSRGWRD